MTGRIPRKRRELVFGSSVVVAGLALIALCLLPCLFPQTEPLSLFPTGKQEAFFYDLFGIIGGFWLLTWVAAVNRWMNVAKFGQWLGIILLCVDQSTLALIWRFVLQQPSMLTELLWLPPLLLQLYLTGFFVGMFTLPSLTESGNHSLTGLGTLMVLLPWLFGAEAAILGVAVLNAVVAH